MLNQQESGFHLQTAVEILADIRDMMRTFAGTPRVTVPASRRRETKVEREQRAIGYLVTHPGADLEDVSRETRIAVRTLQSYVQFMRIRSGMETRLREIDREQYDERDLG